MRVTRCGWNRPGKLVHTARFPVSIPTHPILARVCKRAVHGLPVCDRAIPRPAHDRNRRWQTFPVLADPLLNVHLAELVRAGDDPDPVGGGAAIELPHEVEAFENFWVKNGP